MIIETRNSDFFVGGALPPDSPSYVERPADDLLFNAVQAGQFCYLLAPPRLGKSSLLIRIASHLDKQQIRTAIIYLSGLNVEADVKQGYLSLITRLQFLLKLNVDVNKWWAEQSSSSPAQHFASFLRQVVLAEIETPVVIFLDEIEAIVGLKFAADFLVAIRSIYEARATDSAFQRLTFVLSGVAIPTDLIKDIGLSPFVIAQPIELCDFNREQAGVLQQGLEATYGEQAKAILLRIFHWTSGHPYLTQKLCLAATEISHSRHWADIHPDQVVDRLVEKLFLSEEGRDDIDLLLMREGIATNTHQRRLLALYRQVYEGQAIREDKHSLDQNRLKLVGLVRGENGLLKVRNLIYRQVFNLNWLKISKTSSSSNWLRYAAVGFIILALALTLTMGFSIYNQVQTVIAAQAQPFLDNINNTTDPYVRLTSLASLLKLPGYQNEARHSFYEDLKSEERMALFEQTDPQTVGSELITVIQGVYTAPNLQNNEQDNALLQAMAKSMHALVDDPAYPGAVSLELEINQWLKGREFYNQGQYHQAISSYNLALNLNGNNSGIHFDRGLAYAALAQPDQTLAEFVTVLNLDESWQARVRQALLDNGQLYDALWHESGSYQGLLALVPTPTNTPIPTDTPTPTPTLTPTSTPTSRPPTATPTATPTFIRPPVAAPPTSPAASSPPSPSPALPLDGTITLLAPLSLDEPSYGPTTFQWKWSGPLPADYGFEVRVWKEGAPPTGVHNAVLDNQKGNIKSLGNNTYQLQTDIKDAAGVKGNSGIYWWTVALVKISPKYKDLGQQAPPAQMRFAAPGGGGGSKDSGGGVSIE